MSSPCPATCAKFVCCLWPHLSVQQLPSGVRGDFSMHLLPVLHALLRRAVGHGFARILHEATALRVRVVGQVVEVSATTFHLCFTALLHFHTPLQHAVCEVCLVDSSAVLAQTSTICQRALPRNVLDQRMSTCTSCPDTCQLRAHTLSAFMDGSTVGRDSFQVNFMPLTGKP
eukprot:1142679-Pelagomonas_calceolata.AAC.5